MSTARRPAGRRRGTPSETPGSGTYPGRVFGRAGQTLRRGGGRGKRGGCGSNLMFVVLLFSPFFLCVVFLGCAFLGCRKSKANHLAMYAEGFCVELRLIFGAGAKGDQRRITDLLECAHLETCSLPYLRIIPLKGSQLNNNNRPTCATVNLRIAIGHGHGSLQRHPHDDCCDSPLHGS